MKTPKAIILTGVYLVLLIVAAPGISFLKPTMLRTEQARAEFRDDHGVAAETFASAAADLRRLQQPLARALGSFQPVFRVRQSWHLYRDGPSTIRRMEIQVDGTPVYRTMDESLRWSEDIFRNRRIRPMAETLVKKPRAKNRAGLGRYIVARARADFPDASVVEIRSLWNKRGKDPTVHHRLVASAPDWTLEDVQ